jgi:hypothetical protein
VRADDIGDYLLMAEQRILPVTLSTEKSSWLESVQLRTSIDDSDETKSSYALRIKPKSLGQVSSETTLLELSSKQTIYEYESTLNTELEKRYLQLIKHSEALHRANLLEQQKLTINSEIVIHRSAAKSDDFDPLKLQRSEFQAESINLEILRNLQLIQQLRSDISYNKQVVSSIDINLSIDDIKNNIKRLSQSAIAQDSGNISLKMQIAQANLEREISRQNFGFDFLQLESTKREGNKDPQSYELSIGINLPFGNQYKRSKSLDTLQRIKRKNELATIKINQTEQQLKSTIEIKLAEHTSIQKLLEKLSIRLENLRHMDQKMLLIELKKEQDKYALELSEVNHSLYRDYIKILSFYGQLAKPPIRNWLRHDTPVLASK